MAFVNSANATRREKSIYFNTLAGLVKGLENCYTTVDLRSECSITGKIINVDAFMNIEMEDVMFFDLRGNYKPVIKFYISARNIRNVHVPKNKNAMDLLRSQMECMTRKNTGKSARAFKQVRAQKKNIETIRAAYQDQEEGSCKMKNN